MHTLKPNLRFSFNTLMSMDKNYARNEIVGTNTKTKTGFLFLNFTKNFLMLKISQISYNSIRLKKWIKNGLMISLGLIQSIVNDLDQSQTWTASILNSNWISPDCILRSTN